MDYKKSYPDDLLEKLINECVDSEPFDLNCIEDFFECFEVWRDNPVFNRKIKYEATSLYEGEDSNINERENEYSKKCEYLVYPIQKDSIEQNQIIITIDMPSRGLTWMFPEKRGFKIQVFGTIFSSFTLVLKYRYINLTCVIPINGQSISIIMMHLYQIVGGVNFSKSVLNDMYMDYVKNSFFANSLIRAKKIKFRRGIQNIYDLYQRTQFVYFLKFEEYVSDFLSNEDQVQRKVRHQKALCFQRGIAATDYENLDGSERY